MSNTVCLLGPAFSLIGEGLFIDEAASFSVAFSAAPDSDLVIRYQWYLNDLLMMDHHQSEINFNAAPGRHKVGVRLLTAEGWSGIKSLAFKSYPQPIYTLNGPASVDEGSNTAFAVIANFIDNSTEDYTDRYTFHATEGTFEGNILTIPNNEVLNDDRDITITAKRSGYSDLDKVVTVLNTSEVSTEIVGPGQLQEGSSGTYNVVATYMDQHTEVLSGYEFTASEGTFDGNLLSIAENSVPNDDRAITITATKTNATTLTRQITILDKAIPLEEFDYLVVRFKWGSGNPPGTDLDINVKYENNGTAVDGISVGYREFSGPSHVTVPVGAPENTNALLWWGADSTGNTGIEAVLVGIKRFITTYPSSPNVVEVGLYASWFSVKGDGAFEIELKTYLGGTMTKITATKDFENTGGVLVNASSASTRTDLKSYKKVAVLKYNKTAQNATIQIL